MLTRPTMWSRSSSYTGRRVCRYSSKSLTISSRVALRSIAVMSVRGTITSQTVMSPISMIPVIISPSFSSITPCSSKTWRRVISSCSVR